MATAGVADTFVITAECSAELESYPVTEKRPPVKNVVYPSQSGGWIYEVWIAERPVVIGWCRTREAAEQAAALA